MPIERCAREAGLHVIELEKAGNEFEVLASSYGRCWIWLIEAVADPGLRRALAAAIGRSQTGVNVLAAAAGRWLGRERQRRLF